MRTRVLSIATAVAIGALSWQLMARQPQALLAQLPLATPGPYAGQQHSSVRGLTEEEIATFRSGTGMGLARAGEINGYPGPRHVLALADELDLTDDQRAAIRALESQVFAETVPLGERFLERYAALEQAFRDGTITMESLHERSAEIGQIEGELRAAHLKYHLLTRPLMTDEQIARYNQLRGYGEGGEPQHSPGHHVPGQHGR